MAPLVFTGRSAARTERLLVDRVSVLPRQLDFALLPSSASLTAEDDDPSSSNNELVCFDEELVYTRFFADFGPLNLAQTVQFARDIDARLAHHVNSNSSLGNDDPAVATENEERPVVVVFSSDHPHKRANCMALLVLYLVLSHGRSPCDAVAPFRTLTPPFGFRDAALGVCSFQLSLLDCARAVHKAMATRLWRRETFDVAECERLARLENGDMTWIVPSKLLAFRGPRPQRERTAGDHITTMTATEYAKALQSLGITCVVRFNEPESYDRRAFLHAGIRHVELEYPDGGIPPDAILSQFLCLCECELAVGGAVAAHCAAGLGRTGTHMAAWLMRSAGFSAREAIAWCRVCRPGSVVGQQQHFLAAKQSQLSVITATGDAGSERKTLQEEEVSTDNVRVKARRRPVTMGSEGLRPVVVHHNTKARRQQQKRPQHELRTSSFPTWSSHPTRTRLGKG